MSFYKISRYVAGFCLPFFCAGLILAVPGVRAEDMPPQPEPVMASIPAANPVHELIRQQLAAIKARDADLAWSLTTVKFHEKFETGKEFLTHLRLKLRPVYNHDEIEFLDQSETENGYIQRVEIDEHNGEPVTVIYRLEKQESGEMLIDSFAVLDFEAKPI